jgi:Xaa-Pro aminopeptidase
MTNLNWNERFASMQQQLAEVAIDGWLLYDFRDSNPLAKSLLGIGANVHLTRRWFLYVPREGKPTLLFNSIEGGNWRNLSAGADLILHPYRSHTDLDAALKSVLVPGTKVAMEYSPRGAVPYVSRVDAGTIERVREFGVEVVSSGDLLQIYLRCTDEDLAAHLEASEGLMVAKDAAFKLIHERLKAGKTVDELTVQAEILRVFAERDLITDHPPNVSFAAHAGDPHYEPNPTANATLEMGQCVLIDLWAQKPGRPFADVTWMGSAGAPSEELLKVWQVVSGARDAAVAFLENAYPGAQGWEPDRVAREVITGAGYGEGFTHRLGHDIGTGPLHGSGANLDDFETHDTRTLTSGLITSIEPGVYLPERAVGVRSEINLYYDTEGIRITTPAQKDLFILGVGEWDEIRRNACGE